MNRNLICFAIAMSLAPAAAGAQSFDDRVTRVIPYDPGLDSIDHATSIRRRIAVAADELCLDWAPGPTVSLACRNEAIRGAYAQLNQIQARREPELAANQR